MIVASQKGIDYGKKRHGFKSRFLSMSLKKVKADLDGIYNKYKVIILR